MTEFERELVNAFNDFFEEEDIDGIAHRKKQHRFSSQLCDVLVDSPHEMFYLAIENKSVKTSSTNKLYFSQHFSSSKNGHQVERISEFLDRSGRKGLLAVELKRGRGRPREAYLVPWTEIRRRYENDEAGMHIDEIKEHPEILRSGENYSIAEICINMDL
ncbi:MAG: hypothetical protein ABEI58_02105 [Candidatus Nanohaloarchaea archaeon]